MTEDEKGKLLLIEKRVSEIHRVFMEPPAPGKEPLAREIHDAMSVYRAGKLTFRLSLWAFGFVAAAASAWAAIKGWAGK